MLSLLTIFLILLSRLSRLSTCGNCLYTDGEGFTSSSTAINAKADHHIQLKVKIVNVDKVIVFLFMLQYS